MDILDDAPRKGCEDNLDSSGHRPPLQSLVDLYRHALIHGYMLWRFRVVAKVRGSDLESGLTGIRRIRVVGACRDVDFAIRAQLINGGILSVGYPVASLGLGNGQQIITHPDDVDCSFGRGANRCYGLRLSGVNISADRHGDDYDDET